MNGFTVGNVDELIVNRAETTTVGCKSDGYEIDLDITLGKPKGMFIYDFISLNHGRTRDQ